MSDEAIPEPITAAPPPQVVINNESHKNWFKRDYAYIAIILVLALLYQRSCNEVKVIKQQAAVDLQNSKLSLDSANHKIDQVLAANQAVTDQYSHYVKWANDTVNVLGTKIDSLKRKVIQYKTPLDKLIKDGQEYADKSGDSLFRTRFYEFKALYEGSELVKQQLLDAKTTQDSIHAAEVGACQLVLGSKDSTIKSIAAQLDQQVAMNYRVLSASHKLQLELDAKQKKWGFGPYLGAGYNGVSKFGPSVGISIQRNFIRF